MRVLSGIQPSGKLHIGNYFGAMQQFVEMQNQDAECFFFIADYHAMTSVQDPAQLRANVEEVALGYLAVGIDPEKSVFFPQSQVPAVTELTWALSCVCPMGLLQRCVSYKDKVEQGLAPNHGLFYYPVLQAADIIIYDSDIVPVGQDQKQHIEVTRDLAIKFNNIYGDVLTVPKASIRENTAVIPGLDGRKMSKSYDNTLELFTPQGPTKKKIMRIPTDSTPMEDPKDPDACTVFTLLKLFADEAEQQHWRKRYTEGGMGYGEVKKRLFELSNETLDPFRARYEELKKDMDYVRDVLNEGGKKARAAADVVMERVRSAVGLR
ncbi:MAG: tryptophan--tRNA ligase [Phycisphaerae bacterium]|nr:tryptophan--tRNA ligase [Phycisphaerae bacterium]